MRSTRVGCVGRFEWWVHLRAALVATAATVASFLSAWLVEDLARLHTDVVVLAVVLAVLSNQTGRERRIADHWAGAAVLVPAAMVASQVGSLMVRNTVAGDTLFALALAGAIWIRRWGPTFTAAGTRATLPFIAILVSPVPPSAGLTHAAWSGVMATIAAGWVGGCQVLGHLLRLSPRPAASTPRRRARARGLRPIPSTRMAVQMGLSLGAAFWLGHLLYPHRWTWLVLTAYIVSAGNRGRGDVVHKSVLRVAGAAAGTAAATLLAGAVSPHDPRAVVAVFLALALGTWLRSLSYAYWAASVTAALAFLYDYFGQGGPGLLHTRLEGIGYGAAIAVATAWIVLPIRTGAR